LQAISGGAFWLRLAVALSPIALLGLSAISASAQTGSDFATTTNPLFQALLARPADPNNPLQYAAGAAAAGDIESAISAYEQLLFYNPKLSQTRFQLGVLYYELGSYDMARGYLETALQMPDVTSDLQQKIADLFSTL
jgi:tetratricopeptide (TPR) repeat protein